MAVEIDIDYQGNLLCAAKHGPSGAVLNTDAPVDNGGRGSAFSPTDLVATALGSCLVTIMGIAANTAGLNIVGTHVHVVKEMVADPVRRIGALKVAVTVPNATSLSETDRRKLENAAKVCPVRQSLHPDTQVTMEFVYTD